MVKKCGLQFNLAKCHLLTIGKFDNILHTHLYKVFEEEIEHVFEEEIEHVFEEEIEHVFEEEIEHVFEEEIEHVFEEKDLGVVADSKLSFEEHISKKSENCE